MQPVTGNLKPDNRYYGIENLLDKEEQRFNEQRI